MAAKLNPFNYSPEMSMIGWDLFEFIKKRKKTLITMVGVGIGYIISNNELIAILAGGIVEMGLSVIEFYLKKVRL
jgi:hypothetical protein